MCSRFTDADVGKRVETAAGERIGVVTMTGDETAYVDLEEGVTDSIKAILDWNADTETIVPIGTEAVREVTRDVIRLEGETTRTERTGTEPDIERDERTEHEDEESPAEGDGRSGESVEPETEAMEEAGAERHPDSEDQPPQGDRTVTKERGEREDR